MSEERDPIRGLAAAWRELEPGPLRADLAEADARTRAAVEWMRAAWSRLDAPQALAGRRRAAIIHRPVLLPWKRAAAVAALLIGLGWLGRLHREAATPAETDLGPVARVEPRELAVEPAAPRTAEPGPAPIRPRIHADGSIELRSGKVRLILLPGPGGSESSPSFEPKETR